MCSEEFIYLDVRWQQSGWMEAMRLRLFGSVPDHLVSKGVEKGVFLAWLDGDRKFVALTRRGIELTEPGPHSFTNENCKHLANVLQISGFDIEKLEAGGSHLAQYAGAPLGAAYREKILACLRAD